MKRALFVLALAALLVMAAHSMALGAIHHSTGDMPYEWGGSFNTLWTDTWFYIDGESPKILFTGEFGSDFQDVNALVYKNDQTFIQARFNDPDDEFATIAGSYLFKNNIFAGMDYWVEDSDTWVLLSLGYLFNIGDNDYIVFSVDYRADDPDYGAGLQAYDIDFKFFGDKYYFFGQLYFYEEGDDAHYVALNYQFSETFVGGLFIETDGSEADFGGGFTWSPSVWIVDLYFDAYSDNDTYIELSAMYQAGEKLGIGLEYDKDTFYDEGQLLAKAKYDFSSGQLRAVFGLGNDTYDSYFALAYEMKLK
jgi:hypothetical protein